jgi:hypothetical protein
MSKRLVGRSQGSGRRVLGDAAGRDCRNRRSRSSANGPAVVAEFHGGLLDVSLELGTIVRPTFLVTAKDSPLAFAEATDLLAPATLSARVECIDLEVDSTLQAFCKHRASAGMSPCSA